MTHPLRWSRAALRVAAGLSCLALLAAGCGTQRASNDSTSTSPGSSANLLLGPNGMGPGSLDELRGNGLFHMPLEVGNRWDYDVRTRTRIVKDGVPDEVTDTVTPSRAEITGEQPISGHEYHLLVEYDPRTASPPPAPQFALRQDRSGLYDLDLPALAGSATATPAAGEAVAARFVASVAQAVAGSPDRDAWVTAAARLGARMTFMGMPGRGGRGPGMPGMPGSGRGGPLPGEISLLRYPLFMGASWIVRDSPRFTRTVVGRERVHLPAGDYTAWMLRGDAELYGPQDHVRFWYARQGEVRIRFHGETDATDGQGQVVGRLIVDMDKVLTGFTRAPALAQD